VMIVEKPRIDFALAQGLLDGGQVHRSSGRDCEGLFYTTDDVNLISGSSDLTRARFRSAGSGLTLFH
jgi:hypothetical protein